MGWLVKGKIAKIVFFCKHMAVMGKYTRAVFVQIYFIFQMVFVDSISTVKDI